MHGEVPIPAMSVLKILIQIAKLILALFNKGTSGASGEALPAAPVEPPPSAPEVPQTNPVVPPPPPVSSSGPGGPVVPIVPPPPPTSSPDPNRRGSFIIPDVYPRDLDDPHTPQLDVPPFSHIVGAKVSGKEIIGCYVKASEGLGWGAKNEQWFRDSWRACRTAGGSRYGVDWFRGAYHFLRFSVDGARQADYFCDLIDSAGGWGDGDLMPWVDVEEGGQGSWAGGQKLSDITDPVKRKRLADEVTKCVKDFVARVKQRVPGIRVGVYGRGLYRDLHMTDCRFGADGWCNPAYTEHMPPMDQYGIHLDDIVEWQLCGDGEVHVPGYPSTIPNWGHTDYSAVIDGARQTDLPGVRRRALAKSR